MAMRHHERITVPPLTTCLTQLIQKEQSASYQDYQGKGKGQTCDGGGGLANAGAAGRSTVLPGSR